MGLKAQKIRNKGFIQSLSRGLNILELVANSSNPVSLTEISKITKLNKTTSQRFLNTLCDLNYLIRGEDKRYSLSGKVLSLAQGFLNKSNLLNVSKPYVDELSDETGKTVNLAILEDIYTVFLYRKQIKKFLNYDLVPGSKLPCYAGSLGKVLLAGLNNEELKRRISKVEFYPITPKTITSKEKLWEEIMKTRSRGYGICDQELSMDMFSVAAPILDREGNIIAAINISMEFSYKKHPGLKVMIKKLLEKGKMISSHLGYQGVYPLYPK